MYFLQEYTARKSQCILEALQRNIAFRYSLQCKVSVLFTLHVYYYLTNIEKT